MADAELEALKREIIAELDRYYSGRRVTDDALNG